MVEHNIEVERVWANLNKHKKWRMITAECFKLSNSATLLASRQDKGSQVSLKLTWHSTSQLKDWLRDVLLSRIHFIRSGQLCRTYVQMCLASFTLWLFLCISCKQAHNGFEGCLTAISTGASLICHQN